MTCADLLFSRIPRTEYIGQPNRNKDDSEDSSSWGEKLLGGARVTKSFGRCVFPRFVVPLGCKTKLLA